MSPGRPTSELLGIARFRFHDGQVEEFKRLAAECVTIVREQDSGTLEYAIYLNADESEAIVIERYRDFDALQEHLANIGHLMEPILATASVSGETLGEPSAELRASLAGNDAVELFTPFMAT